MSRAMALWLGLERSRSNCPPAVSDVQNKPETTSRGIDSRSKVLLLPPIDILRQRFSSVSTLHRKALSALLEDTISGVKHHEIPVPGFMPTPERFSLNNPKPLPIRRPPIPGRSKQSHVDFHVPVYWRGHAAKPGPDASSSPSPNPYT